MTTGSPAPYLRDRIGKLVVARERARGQLRQFAGDMAVSLTRVEQILTATPGLDAHDVLRELEQVRAWQPGAIAETVTTIVDAYSREIADLTAVLHDELRTPRLYADPGVWRRRDPKICPWPDEKRTDHTPSERLLAVYKDHTHAALWRGDDLSVAMAEAGPRGDEALGAALAAVTDHDLNLVRSTVHVLRPAGQDATVVVTFPLDDPIEIAATLPVVTRTAVAWDDDAQTWSTTQWDELAGLRGGDGGAGVGFIAKAYAARRDLNDPSTGPLDHRIAVALSTLTGLSSSWDDVASFARHDDLALHLTQPLRIATTREMDEDHPGYDIAYAAGLATKRAQPYLVRADFDGVVTVRHPFVRWQTQLTVPEFVECFGAVIGGAPPAQPPRSPDLHGLGPLT